MLNRTMLFIGALSLGVNGAQLLVTGFNKTVGGVWIGLGIGLMWLALAVSKPRIRIDVEDEDEKGEDR